MEPIVNGLEQEFAHQIVFDRRNAVSAEGKAAMRAFSLRGHPSFAIVSTEGDRLWSFAGFISEEALRQQISQTSISAQY
jgi:hypothetical protein